MTLFSHEVASSIKIIILGLLVAGGVGYLQAAWVGPIAPPPEKNAVSPVNISTASQVKKGNLFLDGLSEQGKPYVNGFVVANGRIGFGLIDIPVTLKLAIDGKVGADAYCDRNGNNCIVPGASPGVLETGFIPTPSSIGTGSGYVQSISGVISAQPYSVTTTSFMVQFAYSVVSCSGCPNPGRVQQNVGPLMLKNSYSKPPSVSLRPSIDPMSGRSGYLWEATP